MRRLRLPPSLVIVLSVTALAAALGLGLRASGATERLELAAVDAMFSVREDPAKAGGLVVVGMDQATLSELEAPQVLPRRLHARMLDRLREAGARAVAYDIQFTEPSDSVEDDNALVEAVERTAAEIPVVLATSEADAQGRHQVFGGIAEELGAVVGHATMPADGDGVTRHLQARAQNLETFPVATARAVTGRLPAPREGWIDFAGPPGTVRELSFVDVLEGRVPDSVLRGRIVVVGGTAVTYQDLHATATSDGEKMAGPELQAQATASVLRGMPLRGAPGLAGAGLVVLAALAGGLGVMTLRRSRRRLWVGLVSACLTFAALLGGLVALVLLAFRAGWILPVTPTFVAFGLAAMLAGALLVSLDAHERVEARMRDAFGRFLPEQAVGAVLEAAGRADGRAGLPGTEIEATVMFADLRGFSSRVEDRGAREVIDFLDRYLTGMSEAILDHGGTVVSYMGDGIMAVFGAPLAQPDHADRALAAAQEMLGPRLAAFNAHLAEHDDGEACGLAIGLHSGPVASGTVGSARRTEYAAVGHTTNLAARLESATRQHGVDLLLSAETLGCLHGEPALRSLGAISVKGIAREVEVLTLPAPVREAAPAQ